MNRSLQHLSAHVNYHALLWDAFDGNPFLKGSLTAITSYKGCFSSERNCREASLRDVSGFLSFTNSWAVFFCSKCQPAFCCPPHIQELLNLKQGSLVSTEALSPSQESLLCRCIRKRNKCAPILYCLLPSQTRTICCLMCEAFSLPEILCSR